MRLDDALTMRPDYIVVGAGPAGCVVAGRLSEDPTVKVLLIEAGGSSDDPRVRLPIGVPMLVTNPKWDWCWETDPDPSLGGRHLTWSAGKCLGGGSSIHGQVHIRCLPSDYDEWADIVDAGGAWSYEDLLPLFIRSENYEGARSALRGNAGPLAVSDITDLHPLAEAFVTAGEELGYERGDLNGETPAGFGFTQAAQREGRRFNAYDGYIRPYTRRPNLGVLTKARVVRVVMHGSVATGVALRAGGRTAVLSAGREVIVSCGAIASANLLMRSGIGPVEVLGAAGVPVNVERPGVGRNLQEHTGVSVSRFIRGHWSLNSARRPDLGARYMLQLLARRRGPFASPVVQAMGFVRTHPSLTRPDLQLHFLPFAYKIKPSSRSALTAEMPLRAAVAMQATLCKPAVRGQVRITGSDELAPPVIDHHLLGDARDVQTLIAGGKLMTSMFGNRSFADAVEEQFNPRVDPVDDAGWERYVRDHTNVAYHHAGTCRMGKASDSAAVVDHELRVIAAQRLRVIDASVMPVVPSGNTYIPTIVVGEKGADMIRSARDI